jgi:thiaminase/transcriptional activator TenA
MFSKEIQKQTLSYSEKFLNHRFLQELSQAKLPAKKFAFYIQQDNIFLNNMDYARRVLASRNSQHAKKLSALIASVHRHELRARRDLITERLKLEKAESAPITLAYTSYLVRLAYQGTFEEALAALIPCPRLYTMIGERYAKCLANKHPLYGRWLAIYSSREMKEWTRQMLEMLDQAAVKNYLKEAMTKSYITACRYEIRFFDMAYTMEDWDQH